MIRKTLNLEQYDQKNAEFGETLSKKHREQWNVIYENIKSRPRNRWRMIKSHSQKP